MATDAIIHPNVASVSNLLLIGGKANTKDWPKPQVVSQLGVDAAGLYIGEGAERTEDRHYGYTRIARGYQLDQFAGREIKNDMQVSIATAGDLTTLAEGLDIYHAELTDKEKLTLVEFMAGALAINIVLKDEGLDNDTLRQYFGPGTKLIFEHEVGKNPDQATIITISEANLPCSKTANALWRGTNLTEYFESYADFVVYWKELAFDLRGWLGSVASPGGGLLVVGDKVALQLPIDNRANLPEYDESPLHRR